MKISNTKPPVYNECAEKFGVKWENGVCFAYGDTIHVHQSYLIPDHLLIHEGTHYEQQMAFGSIAGWWRKYLDDKGFRFSQEAEAYQRQANYIRERYNRHHRRQILKKLATDMTTMYGDFCTREEAENILGMV